MYLLEVKRKDELNQFFGHTLVLVVLSTGGCGSGGRAGHHSSMNAKVFLCKILNPELLLMCLYVNVHEC